MPFNNINSTFFLVLALASCAVLIFVGVQSTLQPRNNAMAYEQMEAAEMEPNGSTLVVNPDGTPFINGDDSNDENGFENDQADEVFIDPNEDFENDPSSFDAAYDVDNETEESSETSTQSTSGRID